MLYVYLQSMYIFPGNHFVKANPVYLHFSSPFVPGRPDFELSSQTLRKALNSTEMQPIQTHIQHILFGTRVKLMLICYLITNLCKIVN